MLCYCVQQHHHQMVVNSIMLDLAPAAGAAAMSACATRTNEIVEDFVEGDGPMPTVVPAEIQCLVEFLVEHALDKVTVRLCHCQRTVCSGLLNIRPF